MSISSICVRFCKHSGTALGCMLFALEDFLEYFCLGYIVNIDSYRLSNKIQKFGIVVLKCLKLLEVFDLARLDRQRPKTW